MSAQASPGPLYLIDTSAHARGHHPLVRNVIAGLIGDRAAATCVTVDLEAGYSDRDLRDTRSLAGWLAYSRVSRNPVYLPV